MCVPGAKEKEQLVTWAQCKWRHISDCWSVGHGNGNLCLLEAPFYMP